MNKGFREFNKKAERLAGIKESRFLKRKSRKTFKRKINESFNKAEIEKLLDQSCLLKLNGYVDVYEDDYEQGEGRNVNSWETNTFSKTYNSLDELANNIKADLAEYLTKESYEDTKESDIDIDDENVHYSVLTDAENSPVTKREIEKWKKGELILYTNQYVINISINGTKIPADLLV